jgi:hypothetical protein
LKQEKENEEEEEEETIQVGGGYIQLFLIRFDLI